MYIVRVFVCMYIDGKGDTGDIELYRQGEIMAVCT